MIKPSVSIIILTKNAGDQFSEVLRSVFSQSYRDIFEVLVIDSGSSDRTLEIAKSFDTRMMVIKPDEFGHGKTRNLGAKIADGDFLIYLTQDAIPTTNEWLSYLVEGFSDENVGGCYGRQIPKKEVKPAEYYFISNRYPQEKSIKQLGTNKQTDINTIFFSNVNSAIRKRIWKKIPFDEDLVMGEDAYWAKMVLINGYKIIYEPLASVYHSHDLNLVTVFQKYFDFGTSFEKFAKKEFTLSAITYGGIKYAVDEYRYLVCKGYLKWLPYTILYDLSKFTGFYAGKKQKLMPLKWKIHMSASPYYWKAVNK